MFEGSTLTGSAATVWLSEVGVPVRMVWRGERWRVSDEPTPLQDLLSFVTHPPRTDGWRFQVTPENGGPSLVVDVVPARDEPGEWVVARVWD